MSKKNLYTVLGVDKDATAEEIKKAYRDKAKENHSDKGGSDDVMSEINNAMAVLSNPTRKAKYDTTGDDRAEPPFEKRFAVEMDALLMQIISMNDDIKTIDIVGLMKEAVLDSITIKEEELEKEKKLLEKMTTVRKRLKSKGDASIINHIEIRISGLKNNIEGTKEEIKFVKKCQSTLKDYEYEFDVIKTVPEREPEETTIMRFFGSKGTGRTSKTDKYGNKL